MQKEIHTFSSSSVLNLAGSKCIIKTRGCKYSLYHLLLCQVWCTRPQAQLHHKNSQNLHFQVATYGSEAWTLERTALTKMNALNSKLWEIAKNFLHRNTKKTSIRGAIKINGWKILQGHQERNILASSNDKTGKRETE